jgi:pimeloyl-ACP methyl ester carboxylesterase
MPTLDRNGSPLWYDVTGSGPRVLWVDPALGSSTMRPLDEALDVLREEFEVATYDRRGRGRSGAGQPTSVEQEIDDLAALVIHLGGADVVVGFSSGGALVVHAAPRLDASVIVLLEPAIDDRPDTSGLRERVAGHIRQGDPAAAVLDFYTAIGTPEEIVDAIKASDVWPDLVRSAPTLLADIDLSHVDDQTAAAVDPPVHVIVSDGSPSEITDMSDGIARRLGAEVWREPGGWHGVEPAALAQRLGALVGVSS